MSWVWDKVESSDNIWLNEISNNNIVYINLMERI